MSIKENNVTGTKQAQDTTQSAKAGGDAAVDFSLGNSFAALTQLRQSPALAFARNRADEAVTRLWSAFDKYMKEKPSSPEYKATVFPMDANQHQTGVGFVVLCISTINATHTAYRAMAIEGSIDVLQHPTANFNGEQITLTRVISDCITDTVRATIMEQVKKHFPNQRLIEVDAMTVPRTFDPSDVDAVADLLAVAAQGTTFELLRVARNMKDVTVAGAKKDASLVAAVKHGQPAITDAVGLPVRADTCITAILQPSNKNNPADPTGVNSAGSVISQTYGYFDLVPQPRQPMAMGMQMGMQPQQFPFITRFVITKHEALNYLTLCGQLLALVPVLAVRHNLNYMLGFRPNPRTRKYRNVGVLGAICNLDNQPSGIGSYFDLDNNYSDKKLAQLFTQTVAQGCLISMDINQADEHTFVNKVFMDAASGNLEARKAIISAMNHLTGNKFSEFFKPESPIAFHDNNRIMNGWFLNDGVKMDIREIDNLMVANCTIEQGTDDLRAFSNTYEDSGTDITVRMSRRDRVIQKMGIEPVYTGRSWRVTFADDFLRACNDAMVACQMSFVPQADDGQFADGDFRGVQNLAAVSGFGQQYSAFNGQMFNQGAGFNMGAGFNIR